jgi:hypothetical protein
MGIVVNGPAVAPITGSTGGVFNVIAGEPGAGAQATLNLPGSGRFNGQQFVVRGSGLVVYPAGTYTASVQPLLYASVTAGYTASAAAAIFSATAHTITVTAATAKSEACFQFEVHLEGDSTTGDLYGYFLGTQGSNVAVAGSGTDTPILTDLTLITNPLTTGVNFSNEPPVQFAIGVTLGSGSPAGSVSLITQWAITAD